MRASLFALCFASLFSCKNTTTRTPDVMNQPPETEQKDWSFYIGTYTDGDSEGIYKARLQHDGSIGTPVLVAAVSNPSYLSFNLHKDTIIAVTERETGKIGAFKVHKDSLSLINESASGGANPCFVAINEAGYVLAANYTGGNLGLLKLESPGKDLSPLLDVEQHSGKGTTERQEGPHAHSAWFIPDGSGIISCDLGTNQLWFSKINTKSQTLQPAKIQKLDLPKGSGPRHLVFHPTNKFIYVLNELNNTVSQIGQNDGRYYVVDSFSTLPKDFVEFSKAADIHVSPDGNFIYASNRGHDSIAIFKVAEDGSLERIATESTRGKYPRNFKLSPDGEWVLVANRNSNNLVSFKRSIETGLMSFVSETPAPSPVCILFE